MDWKEFAEYVGKVESAAQSTAGAAGALGYTAGAAIQGYKDGRAGDQSKFRQINDIDINTHLSEDTDKTIKLITFLAVGAFVFWIIYKKRNK